MDMSEFFKCTNDRDYLASKYFLSEKFCMAYNKTLCEGVIVNAHTISKKYIKNISDNNAIYCPVLSYKNNYLYEFKLSNLRSATCFTGFCRYHDEALFQSFEKSDFNCSYKQIYDISFRALCREYYLKKCLWKYFHKISDGELQVLDNTGYSESQEFKRKRQHLLKEVKDREFLYKEFQKLISSGLSYVVIQTDKLPILTTGILFPLYLPYGGEFQDSNKKQIGFICNVISLVNEAYIIISTVKSPKKKVHSEYLKSLLMLDKKELVNYILTNIFFNNDSIVMKPGWFEQLGDEFKSGLTRLMNLQNGHYADLMFYEIIDFSKVIDFSNVIIKRKNILK